VCSIHFFLFVFVTTPKAASGYPVPIMRLLNTSTFELHQFFGDKIPYYAILSHTWGDDEVTFEDLQTGRGQKMAGWKKIVGCCNQARDEGWKYAVYLFPNFLLTEV
jgi:hypothetical protein